MGVEYLSQKQFEEFYDFEEKIIKDWENGNYRPKYDNFLGVYEKQEIERDKNKIEEIKKSKEYLKEKGEWGEKGLLARAFEYTMMEGIQSYNWLGENVDVTPTNEYDDIKNGIDLVLSFYDEENNKYYYLGIDTTINESKEEVLRKKFKPLADGLMEKRGPFLPEVRYFSNTQKRDDKTKGKIALPKIILGTDRETARKLKDIMPESEMKEKIANDKIQLEFIMEIKNQLLGSINLILEPYYPLLKLRFENLEDVLVYMNKEAEKIKVVGEKVYEALKKYSTIGKFILSIEKEKVGLGEIDSERLSIPPLNFLLEENIFRESLQI